MPGYEIDMYEDVTSPRPGTDLVRFFLIPFAVSLILVGEVYWLRQLATGSSAREQSSTSLIQVQLLVRPDPIPIAVETVAPLISPSIDLRPPPNVEEPNHPVEDDTSTNLMTLSALPATEPATISPVTPVPAAVENTQSKAVVKFQKALLRHIDRYKIYPNMARRDRLRGTVEVLFAMRRDGTVLDIQIKTSSGAVILDKEAVETIRRAQPLPPIPLELPPHLNILLPVAFDLS